jgi:GxxExxY protein
LPRWCWSYAARACKWRRNLRCRFTSTTGFSGRFTPDLLVNGVVIVEVKAVRTIDGAHKAQVINYLKASNIEVALLLNFGDTPQFQRFKFDNARKAARKPPEELEGA